MTESELKHISEDIEYLKKAVKRNDPLLRQMAAPPGWTLLSCIAGTLITLFALPAHFLSRQYGSFESIPITFKTILFTLLAILFVVGGISKMIMLSKKLGTLESGYNFGSIFKSFFGGRFAHTTIPSTVVLILFVVYAWTNGMAWISLPLTSVIIGLMCNQIGERSGVRSYFAFGYWAIIGGSLSLFLAEQAAFLWIFIIYGGGFFVFAAALLAEKPTKSKKTP